MALGCAAILGFLRVVFLAAAIDDWLVLFSDLTRFLGGIGAFVGVACVFV